mgnify:CR=1 FL=1
MTAQVTPEAIEALATSLDEESTARLDALNAVVDEAARLFFAQTAYELSLEDPAIVSFSLLDWEDEVDEGDPFDVAAHEAYRSDAGDETTDLDHGAVSIRHHWVLDELRVDPTEEDKYAPGSRISVAKSLAWLADKIEERS